jgi:superfamily II DNA/RNA helicase
VSNIQQSSFNLRDVIENSIGYLRERHHPEKPHISVLSPPLENIAEGLWQKVAQVCPDSKNGGEEDVEDEDVEEVIDELYSSRNPGHVFGIDLLNADLGSGYISITFNFYVRTSYDYDDESKRRKDAYTKVIIKGEVNKGAITYNIQVEPDDLNKPKWSSSTLSTPLKIPVTKTNNCLATSLLFLPLNQDKARLFIEKYLNYVFRRLATVNLPVQGYIDRHVALTVGRGDKLESLGNNVFAIPIGTFSDAPWLSLRGEVYDKHSAREDENEKPLAYYYPAFGVILGLCRGNDGNYVVKSYLINLGGLLMLNPSYEKLDDRNNRRAGEVVEDYCKRHRVFTWNNHEGAGTRWALGYLLEVEGSVEALEGAGLNVQWSAERGGLLNAHLYNAMFICEDDVCSRGKLRDYYIEEEVLPPIRRGSHEVEEYFGDLLSKLNVDDGCKEKLHPLFKALANVLSKGNTVNRLYEYQEQAIEEVLASQGLINKPGVKDKIVITARTAGGKTFAFLIPAIITSAYRKLCRGENVGVKAILMYPTKALANDQVEEVAHMLYYLHNYMHQRGSGVELTFGVLHGNVKHKGEAQQVLLPMHCPIHNTLIEFDAKQGVMCTGNNDCSFAKFISDYMKITRDDIYGEPPDILITDEDMMNRILSGVGTSEGENEEKRSKPSNYYWFEWSIFGSPYKKCAHCGFVYPLEWSGKKCVKCGFDLSNAEPISNISKPSLIVLDEAHMLTGSFGAQVHHLLSLLEYIIGKLSSNLSHKVTYVMASATMGNPEEFAASIFGVGKSDVKVIQAEVEQGVEEEKYKRYFAFIMPKTYTIDATSTRLIARFINEYKKVRDEVPKGVIFTNFLDESNEILHSLKIDEEVQAALKGKTEDKISDRIGGHTTDYDEDRVEVENKFKEGGLDILVATSTLELGIDYGVIDFVAVYGMPNTLTSYIQRIGRAGRRRDAVVLTIFDPERRIDYYFFENYKLLSDGKLRERALKRETYPVGASNEEAVRRAVRRFATAVVKLCCVTGSCKKSNYACHVIIDGIIEVSARRNFWSFMADYLSTSFSNMDVPSSIGKLQNIPPIKSIIGKEVDQILQFLRSQSAVDTRNLKVFINNLGGGETLYNLRAADVSVRFDFNLEGVKSSRYRELRYAIKHALPGQIVSYRGYFFSSKSIDSNTSKKDKLKLFLS